MGTIARRKGMATVWIVLLFLVLIGIAGLACDAAWLFFVGQQLQNAADAGALAGAQTLRVDRLPATRQKAAATAGGNWAARASVYLDLNASNNPGGDIVIGRYHRKTRTFTPTETGADAVKVVARRPDAAGRSLGLIFGPIFGVNTAQVRRQAIGMTISGTGAAVLVLNPDAPNAFRMNGNFILNVANGCIQVNSDHKQAVSTSGNPVIVASDLNTCSESGSLGPNTTFTGNLNTNVAPMDDPLAGLPLPVAGAPKYVPTGDDVTISEGYYPEGIRLTVGTLRLNPGIYIISGEGLQITGGNFYAYGVLLYITGDRKTCVNVRGNGNIEITPMTSGPYAGVTFFQDPALESTAFIEGTNQMHIKGTLYFPSAEFDGSGTGDSFGNQLIADTVEFSGTGNALIDYDGRFARPGRAFLVE